jgi:uncharacterized sulfatase
MLSGLRPERTGVMTNGTHVTLGAKDAPLLPRFMRQKGYFSARVGKIFHDSKRMIDGKPMRTTDDPKGWDISEDEAFGEDDESEEVTAARESQGGGELRRFVKSEEGDEAIGDGIVARKVAEILEKRRATDRPFFMAAGFRKPHLPWIAPKKYFDLYPLDKISPASYPADHVKSILPLAMNKSAGQDTEPQRAKELIAAYLACVSYMDAQVGFILDALARLKLEENTLVIFAGDHGFHLGDHGMWGKSTLFERAVRTPMIVAGPASMGMARGGSCPRTVELLDVYPTVVDLCGLPTPGPLQGVSLRPLLVKPDEKWDRPALTALRHERTLGRSVRDERYRYTEWDGGKAGVELYDYEKDSQEWRNIAKDSGSEGVIKKMQGYLRGT